MLVLPLVGVERVGGVGGWVEQASCWVLKQQTVSVVVLGRPRIAHHTGPGFGCLVVGVGVGCAGCLRITQWTRASLWSSCRGQTVDAWAPGADEGRGRPR